MTVESGVCTQGSEEHKNEASDRLEMWDSSYFHGRQTYANIVYRQHTQTHLVVESGEVCVPSKNNPALIWSLSDQDLVYLQQR